MEVLGFETEPDYAMWNGEFGGENWRDDSQSTERQHKPTDPYQSEDERKRVTASRPSRDVRFQYRLTAVDHATESANLLPARSQAFAVVLCQATQWVIDRDPQRAKQIYSRYLREGAYVPWGRSFGKQCPEPDFGSASNWSILRREAKSMVRHSHAHPFVAASIAALSLGMFSVFIYSGSLWKAVRSRKRV